MNKITSCLTILFTIISLAQTGIVPLGQVMLYPNTQNSPSLYVIKFQTSLDLVTNQFILISMDWLTNIINPYSCILVYSNITISCTNLDTPSFSLGFSVATLRVFNPQIIANKTIAIKLLNPLPANQPYTLQIGLYNIVENMKKISPSMEIYTINANGLIYQQNLNFGPVAYKPPITNLLGVSIYTDVNNLALGVPGTLVTLKAQITISVSVTSSLSSLFFVLQNPFQLQKSAYITVDQAQEYATNPINLYKRPSVAFYQVVTPHLFYVAFNQSFIAGRKFIVLVTEIRNPFFIASSNVSIYSANFNSLTPLQAFQSLFPLKTVTQTLTLSLGLPYDMPNVGPCVFYRSQDNYYQVKFNMPNDVPAGYAIKVQAFQNTIYEGTAFVNFQSLTYSTIYEYFGGNYFIMRGMGPISQGSLISIIFKANKNSITNFYVAIYIDTQAIIQAGTASSYMFYGRVDDQSVDSTSLFSYFYSGPQYQYSRIDTAMSGTDSLRINYAPSVPTSTGSYVQFFLPPTTIFDPTFNPNTDCTFSGAANSAVCTITSSANYVYIAFRASSSRSINTPNSFPQSTGTWIWIQNIRCPQPSSAKYPYAIYTRLFNSSAVNANTYIQMVSASVLPRSNTLTGVKLTQMGNVNTASTFKYPGFVRFQCSSPSDMSYILQQNEVRVISIISTYGFRGLSVYKNQDQYPCSSNTLVTCIYQRGINAVGSWWLLQNYIQLQRIDIFFKNGSTETTQPFHIIIPDGINVASGSNYYYFYLIGAYNLLTKQYKYLYRNTQVYRYPNWVAAGANYQANTYVDFQGKAGSYRQNVFTNITLNNVRLNYMSYVVIVTNWQLFQYPFSQYTIPAANSTNPIFYSSQKCPLSVNIGSGMYMAVFPFQLTANLNYFTFYLDYLHMPYHYDLPNYYIYVIGDSTTNNDGYNQMIYSDQFQMTNQGVFYYTYLQSLSINCLQNYLGVQNTICTIVFGTQNPVRANGQVLLVFSGMNVATSTCAFYLPNGTAVQSSCLSTSDDKNVTISLVDTYNAYHYPANNFTVTVNGISIVETQISQSVTVYLSDSTGKYVTQMGTRILTTTVSQPSSIMINQIVYKYLSPLSANKISIHFQLPRTIYSDERLGFLMGKDLSDVNTQLQRLKIVLTRSDGLVLPCTSQLISAQYKVLFTFNNPALLTPTSYNLQIFGIMTPVSQQNGVFSIIYQRGFDQAYTLTNAITTQFPQFYDRISSNISMNAFFNTEGYQQKLVFSMINSKKVVNSKMVWIINLPSYYNEHLFNYNAYCLIDTTPIQCFADPTTRFQLIIRNSPKLIPSGTSYTLSVYRLTCPRAKYTNSYYPARYMFIGALQQQNSNLYCQSALLLPQQNIQTTVNGILTITDFIVNSLNRPTFSSVYAIVSITCNVAIPVNNYLYLIFPFQFDNFNNNQINFIFKVNGNIMFSNTANVVDRTLQIYFTIGLVINTAFTIQFPSLPTPKSACSVSMSEMIVFITPNNKKSIIAASSIAGNSAPIITFTADPRYLSFNLDNTIHITAGTYSQLIDITASDNNTFLTNIVVNLTSTGFTFDPPQVFLKLGDIKGKFRVSADAGLFPISYFYDTVKSQEVFTYYTITKNNNIEVTNNPVTITLPTNINIPIGGCSTPITIDIENPPIHDVSININYNNRIYNQSIFYPNIHTTKSTLVYNSTVTKNMFSFCIASNFAILSLNNVFTAKFVLSGTNYASYSFEPNQNVTFTVVPPVSLANAPALTIQLINRQKTFLDFNITPTVPGTIFYHLQIGYNVAPLDLTKLQVYFINNQNIIQSKNDFMTYLYANDRDMRVGVSVASSIGVFTLRQSNLLPERYYTLCAYLQTFNNIKTQPFCVYEYTQSWGVIMKAKLTFSSTLNTQNLNNVLCFFTKAINTQVIYAVDLEGNSCNNRAVDNLQYNYRGNTFTSQNKATNLYIITNPTISSDPSPTAFLNMYDSSSQLTSASISSALSGFAINFLQSSYLGSIDAISMISATNADNIAISFDNPIYDSTTATITVPNVQLSTSGSVYFLLVLYKQVNLDGNNSFVKIRLNGQPTQQQILNCLNYQALPAEGCARAVYSYIAQTVLFNNIQPNSMYMLYYMAASEFPLRPIVSSIIQSNSIVAFISQKMLSLAFALMVCLFIMLNV